MARSKKTAAVLKMMNEAEERAAPTQAGEEIRMEESEDEDQHESDSKEEYQQEEEREGDDQDDESGEDEEVGSEEDEGQDGKEVPHEASGRHAITSKKRRRAFSDADLHYVPLMKKRHKSWEAFEAYLDRYSRKTSTKTVVNEMVNVSLPNRRLKKQKQHIGKPKSKIPFVPDSMGPYQRVYICTHGWKPRSRSTGKRPVQSTLSSGCEFRFIAQVTQRSRGKWGIEVKREFYGHNHQVSEEVYRSHPGIRQVPKKSRVMDGVKLMVKVGGRPSRIYDYIRSSTPYRVLMGDVHNMIRRIKTSESRFATKERNLRR